MPPCCSLPPRTLRSRLLARLIRLPLWRLPPPPMRLATEPAKLPVRLASDPGAPAGLFALELALP